MSVESVVSKKSGRATVCVLVPTYRRPQDLQRCLLALEGQTRPADEVIVVHRDSDYETTHFLASTFVTALPITIVTVRAPGLVAALNAGLERVTAEIVAITDDDGAPHPDWLERIERHFVDKPEVGGVGGRDHIDGIHDGRGKRRVGKMQWFGRTIGNHHLGMGPPRYVDFLKGANMSYRMEAVADIRFDERLRGTGAQVHNEICFGRSLRSRGWELLYDPQVAIDHFPAKRFGEDQRMTPTLGAIFDHAFNETLAALEYLPPRQHAFYWIWAVFVGSRPCPGLLQCVRGLPSNPPAWKRLRPVFSARFAAARAVRRYRPASAPKKPAFSARG